MPELPEIKTLARQMKKEFTGRRIVEVFSAQEKCLNQPIDVFTQQLCHREILDVTSHGKWVVMSLQGARLLMNMNMGADILLHPPLAQLPAYKVQLVFDDGRNLTVRFWFLGMVHVVPEGQTHAQVDALGPDILDDDFTFEVFDSILAKRKMTIKNLLLNQNRMSGLGNYYVHDILYEAGIHPLRMASSLDAGERQALYQSLRSVLQAAVDQGGSHYEMDLFGNKGTYEADRVAYQKGNCSKCQSPIEKIKTGGTSSYICPQCQKV